MAQASSDLSASIRSNVTRITESAQFAGSSRLRRLLRHCVEHTLEDRKDRLKETLLGMDVFDRGPSFDPRTDSIVRVDARRLRLKLAEYYHGIGLADAIEIVFAPGSYVPSFRERNTQEKPLSQSGSELRGIAVLPFLNLTSDAEMEYFCDGLTEEVIATLARVRSLRVVARTSVFQFKGKTHDIREIASLLSVDRVLEGSVRKSGTKVRVTAQLIGAADGCHLWSATYDRELEDIFVLQEDIARGIGGMLNEQVPLRSRRTLRNPIAYQHYARGRYMFHQLTPVSLRQAIACFEQAISEDPAYAAPHAGIANCYALLGIFDLPPGEAKPKSKLAAVAALALDDEEPEAHAALGGIKFTYDLDFAGAELAFQRALELSPGHTRVYEWRTMMLACAGRADEGLETIRWAQSLDPLSPIINANIGLMLYVGRHYEDALESFRLALAMDPNFYWTYWHLSMTYSAVARFEEAVAAGRKAWDLSRGTTPILGVIGLAYALSGNQAAAAKTLNELEARSQHEHVSPVPVALIHAALGDRTAAFEYLTRAVAERNPLLFWINWPLFDMLRDDPRFGALINAMGQHLSK